LADLVGLAADATLDDEIAVVRVALRRALMALHSDELSSEETAHLVPAVFAGARTVARLLREQKLLSGESADSLMSELSSALDELSAEWGVQL